MLNKAQGWSVVILCCQILPCTIKKILVHSHSRVIDVPCFGICSMTTQQGGHCYITYKSDYVFRSPVWDCRVWFLCWIFVFLEKLKVFSVTYPHSWHCCITLKKTTSQINYFINYILMASQQTDTSLVQEQMVVYRHYIKQTSISNRALELTKHINWVIRSLVDSSMPVWITAQLIQW